MLSILEALGVRRVRVEERPRDVEPEQRQGAGGGAGAAAPGTRDEQQRPLHGGRPYRLRWTDRGPVADTGHSGHTRHAP